MLNLVTDGTLTGRGTPISPLKIDIDATDINVDNNSNPKVLLSKKIANLGSDISVVSGDISIVKTEIDVANSNISNISSGLTGLNSKIDSNINVISNDVSVLRGTINDIDNSGSMPSLITDGTLSGSGTVVSPLKVDIDATDINLDNTANPKVLLSDKIANLGNDMGVVSSDVSVITSDIVGLNSKIDANINVVSSDVSVLKGKIGDINNDVVNINSDLASINSEIDNINIVSSDVSVLKSKIDTVDDGIADIGGTLNDLTSKIGNLNDLQNGANLVDAINSGGNRGDGPPIVGSYRLLSYPNDTLITNMIGFADSLKLVVEDAVPGKLYRLYSDSSCKHPISNWQEALPYETSFVVSVNEVKIHYFYISREDSGLPSCYSTGKGYNKIAVDLILSGIDNVINYSFTKHDSISYYLKLGTASETEVSINNGQLPASVGVHNVRIRAIDSNGKEALKSSYVNVQGTVTMATTLYTTMDTLLYSPGFSSNIKIKVAGYAIGDIVGIYSDSLCNTPIIEQPMTSLDYKFTVPAEMGSNTYYVRKLMLPSLTPSTCIATNTYIRSDIEVLSETLELGIKLTFGMTTIVPNSPHSTAKCNLINQ